LQVGAGRLPRHEPKGWAMPEKDPVKEMIDSLGPEWIDALRTKLRELEEAQYRAKHSVPDGQPYHDVGDEDPYY